MKRLGYIILALGLMCAPLAVHAVPAVEIIENDYRRQWSDASARYQRYEPDAAYL